MERKRTLIFLIVLVVALSSILLIRNRGIIGAVLGIHETESEAISPIDINYGNIEQMLSQNNIIVNLPEDSVVLLRLYNSDTGKREWERSYIITKEKVEEGYTYVSDITILMDSAYLRPLNNLNICETIREAKKNSSFSVSSSLSNPKLIWKYRELLKYRKCLGF